MWSFHPSFFNTDNFNCRMIVVTIILQWLAVVLMSIPSTSIIYNSVPGFNIFNIIIISHPDVTQCLVFMVV